MSADWDDVRVFLAAHRTKSLGAAAAKLGLDTSTVSRRVAGFEAAVGAQLFERTRSGLVPTHAATATLAAAEAMEQAWSRLSRDVSTADVDEVAGTVRITVAPGMADAFIAPLLPKLRTLHPQLVIELDATTSPRDLSKHEAEIALRSVKPVGDQLVAKTLGTDRWVIAGAPSLLATAKKAATGDALPWITWDSDLAQFAPAKWVARHVDKRSIALRTSHFASQLVAARHGLGVLLSPRPYLPLHGLSVWTPKS
ncbi:MAG TPA: LysR family transcriptional regulator, partial [Myxococcota bacterium]